MWNHNEEMSILFLLLSLGFIFLLGLHSWYFRGGKTTLLYFFTSLTFGIFRSNVIDYIITKHLYSKSLPYLFTRPVLRIGQATIQECIGWSMIIYLGWSVSEAILKRYDSRRDGISLSRLFSLVCIFLGVSSYALEAFATASQWWIWTIQINNPFFVMVPWAGIIAWISVGIDFFVPFYLLAVRGVKENRWYLLSLLLFPLHMLIHTTNRFLSINWLPLLPEELYHWFLLFIILAGLIIGRFNVDTGRSRKDSGNLINHIPEIIVAALLLVIGTRHIMLGHSPAYLITVIPLLCFMALVHSRLASLLLLAAASVYHLLINGSATNLIFPFLVEFSLLYPVAGARLAGRFHGKQLRWIKLTAFLIAAYSLALIYNFYVQRNQRYSGIMNFIDLGNSGGGYETLRNIKLGSLVPDGIMVLDAVPLNQAGNILYENGMYEQAAFFWERAFRCDTTFHVVCGKLAEVYLKLDRLELAAKFYERELSMNPVKLESYLELGELYENMGRSDLALDTYNRGRKYLPESRSLRFASEKLLQQHSAE